MVIVRLNFQLLPDCSLRWTREAIRLLFGPDSTPSTRIPIPRSLEPSTPAKPASYWPIWRKIRATLSCRLPSEVQSLVYASSQSHSNKVGGTTFALSTEGHVRLLRLALLFSSTGNSWSK